MKKMYLLPVWVGLLIIAGTFFSCGEKKDMAIYRQADSLNLLSYHMRYKNLDTACKAAHEAYKLSEQFPSLRAAALNNLGFCAFIHMDFEKAEDLFLSVYDESDNELECLVADIGMMKICQRTAMNKEFYDYRNSALRRMKRISDGRSAITDPEEVERLNYARSEFSIASAIYYYYLQQEQQSLEAINEIKVDEALERDTAQLLYYYYMKGSGGMYEAETPQDVVLGEFNYLIDCLNISHANGYIYFEANALQALAELLKEKKNYDLLMERKSNVMRAVNSRDLPWEELTMHFAEKALDLFKKYGDLYQISGTYRTLASCCNEQGRYEDALHYLSEALGYVNRHHEKYYHCTDTTDRLRPYVPMATNSIELEWINDDGIKSVPEWIARFREQLSVTFAALGMKPQSDYNRNIYLDILDYTRQDKELESRFNALEKESESLNGLLVVVIIGIVVLIILFWILNKRWRVRNTLYIDKLKRTLEICRKITASVPIDASEIKDVTEAVVDSVKEDILGLVGATDFRIVTAEEGVEEEESEPVEGICTRFVLSIPGKEQPLGEAHLYSAHKMKKDDKALMQVIAPYISWTLENGLTFISLGDERKRLEKEQYVHEQHLAENKRQNLVKKACLFIVTGIMPYIDRIINEVHKLTAHNYIRNEEIKESKYRYIDELITRINEYNDILALWIKMRQGTLSLNIENFELNSLFDVLVKGCKTFEMKQQTLLVETTTAIVKADKALTLFMINTLTENARKYTQPGGSISVSAQETDAYVEISIQDNGPGLSQEDVDRILSEKVYDSGKIGLQTCEDVNELQKNKGHGFGLMNCKGIIEKYRKTNEIFRVCLFNIESEVGKGSRFYFRLPKGVRKALMLLMLICLPAFIGCSGESNDNGQQMDDSTLNDSIQRYDKWLAEANEYAYDVYNCNIDGLYQQALCYADSALYCLNKHYKMYSGHDGPLLKLEGEGTPADLEWFNQHFDTDYYAILDVRNESAVAFLALGNLAAYRYNNNAYTALYKQISEDTSLEQYCRQMQLSANNKTVAIILCVVLVLALLIGYYVLYFRHRLIYRYNLEQVLEINKQVFAVSLLNGKADMAIAACLVNDMFAGVNDLLAIDELGIAVYNEDTHNLKYAFSPSEDDNEDMREIMARTFDSETPYWKEKDRIKCLPLWVEAGGENRCTGVLAVKSALASEREDDRLMLELVAGYVAIIVYNAVVLVAQKYRDIESALDDARRAIREENQLHVQNLVLDNCLSTIKHETIYYPNKIKQIIDKLNARQLGENEEAQVETISELISYYKDIFTLLSSCAARQLEEITFRRGTVRARDLADYANRYIKRAGKRLPHRVELKTEVEEVAMLGDVIQLKFMLENLIDEALSYEADGLLVLHFYKEGDFVRFDFRDTRREKSQEELNQLFYPHLSRMRQGQEGVLKGTEYLICKQVIRDHDEFAGRRGCRINAQPAADGGFIVWFTIPAR
ncbi:MAG: DUF5113 domain-containing protein [Bacteroides sp.]|nr:DUF5113 domain-containing protein [Bacteroides sp.]